MRIRCGIGDLIALLCVCGRCRHAQVNEPLIFEMVRVFVGLVNEFVPGTHTHGAHAYDASLFCSLASRFPIRFSCHLSTPDLRAYSICMVSVVLIDSSFVMPSLPLQCTADSGPRPGVSWFKIPTFMAPDTLLFKVCHPWSIMSEARGQHNPIQQFVERYGQYLDDRLPPFQDKMSLPPSPAPTDRWKTLFSFASYSTSVSFGNAVCNTLIAVEMFIAKNPYRFLVSCLFVVLQ